MVSFAVSETSPKWIATHGHRQWLRRQAENLFHFFERGSINPRGGFFALDDRGEPMSGTDVTNTDMSGNDVTSAGSSCLLHTTTRMVHCFSIAYLLGRPGSDVIVDHGMRFLWERHRDSSNGGYFWSIGNNQPSDDTKQAYGHAFVLLAASSAKIAGHPDADRLLADVSNVLAEHFWEDAHGAMAEQFTCDWQSFDNYRGQNSNMHTTEALMAAFEATGDSNYLRMAERIADLIVRRRTAENDWRLPEHYTVDWQVNREYSGSPIFRPYGTMPGHWLEWARLTLQLWELGGRKLDWLPDAAKRLFRRAATDGWDTEKGGFFSTLEWDGSPRTRNRYWWACCEGIGAAAFLNAIDGDAFYEEWYRQIWNFSAAHLIDHRYGGWHPQIGEDLKSNTNPFYGKPDIYHALQACIIPLLPTTGSITRGIVCANLRSAEQKTLV